MPFVASLIGPSAWHPVDQLVADLVWTEHAIHCTTIAKLDAASDLVTFIIAVAEQISQLSCETQEENTYNMMNRSAFSIFVAFSMMSKVL